MARTSRWLPWLSLAAFTLSLGALADPALAKTVTDPQDGGQVRRRSGLPQPLASRHQAGRHR